MKRAGLAVVAVALAVALIGAAKPNETPESVKAWALVIGAQVPGTEASDET